MPPMAKSAMAVLLRTDPIRVLDARDLPLSECIDFFVDAVGYCSDYPGEGDPGK